MAHESSAPKRRDKLFEKAMAALVVGVALLVVPRLMANPVLNEALANATRIAGWCALAIGLALLALHFMLPRRPGEAAASKHDPEWSSQLPPELLRRHRGGFDHTETPPITRSMKPDRTARPTRPRDGKA
jgi:hypothetical protein